MHHLPKPRPYSISGANPPARTAVPDAQHRALERRHALDEQQRHFDTGAVPTPHFHRTRPPS